MIHASYLRSAVCVAALVSAGAAQADVTAAQVWEDWKTQMGLYGDANLSIGAEETSGGTLTVRDIELAMDDGEAQFNLDMGDLTFTERGDGSVSVTMDDSFPFTITDGDTVVTILITQSNHEMIVDGTPDAFNYALSADSYSIALQDVVDGAETFEGVASLTMKGVAASYTTTGDALREITYDVAADAFEFLVDFQIPETDGEYLVASGKIDGMKMNADMAVPADADFENGEDLFADGLSMVGGYEIGGGEYIFDINADGTKAAGSASTGETNLAFEMNSQRMAYETLTKGLAVSVNTSQLPFPVELSMAEYGLGFDFPVGKSEEISDVKLNINLLDLAISDSLWSLFDPGAILPRDAATVQLDIAGKGRALFDFLDPTQTALIDNADMPFEMESLSLNQLKIALAGALVTGAGDFTFDNTDLTTFNGAPRPAGDAKIEVSGLNGLMDNLVEMGIVPEDQIMGGRMMLGMVARTVGDDQLETTVEINDEGHVIVNGQRMY